MASGVVIALVALGLVFHVDDHLAKISTPGYTTFLQNKIEDSSSGKRELAKLRGGGRSAGRRARRRRAASPTTASRRSSTPTATGSTRKPLTLAQLRGKVVLIDFWTYSCINCLRTLPHLKAWYATYRKQGLVIIGVHTPEFAFEHVSSNVRAAVKRLGIKYPVVQDNRFKTWDNYANQYWPAEYLIDKTGHVRHTHFGEGEYGETESADPAAARRARARSRRRMPDTTPTGLLTPETYLGYAAPRATTSGTPISPDIVAHVPAARRSCRRTRSPTAAQWQRRRPSAIVAGRDAPPRAALPREERLHRARRARHRARLDRRQAVEDAPRDAQRLYTVRASKRTADATLELAFTPGVQAYSFTFG